jgi:hypothetical protein
MSSKVILTTIFTFFVFSLYQGFFYQVTPLYSYEDCKFDGNIYRPGGKCKETTPYVNAYIDQYPLTCSSPPTADVKTSYCGEEDLPQRVTCPVGGGDCAVVNTYIDLTKAQIGGLGPDDVTYFGSSPDILASYYPFIGLADKPIDPNGAPREAYRTFWRFQNLNTIFSAKALLLQKFVYGQGLFINPYYPPINNYEIPYYSTSGLSLAGSSTGETGSVPARYIKPGPTPQAQPSRSSVCGGGQIDMLEYFMPHDSTLIQMMTNGERFQTYPTTIDGRPGFVLMKSADPHFYEEFTYDNQYIYHLRDTTWDNKCSNGQRAFYSLFTGEQEGGPYIERCITPGRTYNITATIKAFNRQTCTPCDAGFGLSAEAGTTYVVNLEGDDAVINNIGGSGAGEAKVYTKNKGLTGFRDTVKFLGDGNKSGGEAHGEPFPLENTCTQIGTDKLPTVTLKQLTEILPNSLKNYPVSSTALADYNRLDDETKAKYDALTPFILDNARGYLVSDHLAMGGSILGPPNNFRVARENLAYVYATNDVLNEPAFGLLPSLLPGWIDERRLGQLTSKDIVAPEETWGFLSARYNTFIGKMKSDTPYGVWAQDGNTGIKGCRIFTKGPTLESPLTYANPWVNMEKPQFDQQILVPIDITPDGTCEGTDANGNPITKTKYKVGINGERKTRENGNVVQDTFGRSIAVYSNPKQKDISLAISEPGDDGVNNSLYHALIPGFALEHKTHEDIPMLAKEMPQDGEAEGGEKIARWDGEAEIDLCTLRNFWFRSAGQQRGNKGVCEKPDTQVQSPINTPNYQNSSPSGEVKQHLFEPTCGGQVCYDYIINQVSAAPRCQGKYLNPYVAIAIALNEDGGLVSNKQDGTNIKHFGCDPYGTLGTAPTVEAKLSCMMNTFANDCSKTEAAALSEYGYLSGNNLNALVGLLGGDFPCNGAYCFSLWVSGSDAQSYGAALKSTLPNQRNLWYRYYSGYINSYK